jgi:TPR repeat protein
MRAAIAVLSLAMMTSACATVKDSEELKTIFDRGVAAYDAGNYAEAFALFKSIDQEDVAAARNEGIMLRKGQGVAKDPEEAERVLQLAAEDGLPTAQYDYAEMLMDGEAGSPDVKGAVPWLTLAASAGHPIAEYRLGTLYEQGVYVDKDIEKAKSLYADAAARGVTAAADRLKELGGPPPRPLHPQETAPVSPPPPATGP